MNKKLADPVKPKGPVLADVIINAINDLACLDDVCRIITVAQARAAELRKQSAAKIVIQYRTKENGKVLHGGIIWPSVDDLKKRYPDSLFTVTCAGAAAPTAKR